jgi:hypothetical protein
MIGDGGEIDSLKEVVNGSPDDAINKFGFNNDVDTGASEDIWSAGGIYPYATFQTPKILEILSSSVNDVPAGTGAQEISVFGLDENGIEKSEVVVTNGVAPVALSGQWTAINRAFINNGKTGLLGTNDGIITIRVSGGGTIVSEIPAQRGQTQQCIYRVPSGKTLRITHLISYTDASVGKTASLQLILVGSDCLTTRVLSSGTATENSKWERLYDKGGKQFSAGEWAIIRVLSVAQNDTAVTADFDGILE